LARPEKSHPVRHKQLRRLSDEEIADMTEQYQGGKTVYQLAPIFGIARQTVGIILQRQRVDTRNRRNSRKARP
jgi:transposase-like protein